MVSFIRYGTAFKVYEAIQPYLKYSLPVEEKLPADNVLVLAPHPDDEAVGCGGTILLHTARGGTAGLAYCTTDGEPRQSEAARAASVLGVSSRVSFNYPVESLQFQNTLPGKLIELFEEKKPEIVFVPFLIDNHTDHRGLNGALLKVAKMKSFNFVVYAYPVWFPLYPNVLVDIGTVQDKKNQAIRCYSSQLASRDFVLMSGSLCRYWAEVKGRGMQYAESFFKASFSEYVMIGRKIYGEG